MPKKNHRAEDRKTNYRLKGQFTRNVTYSPLPPSLSKLLCLIAEHLNGKCDCLLAWPSQGRLAEMLGLTRRRVEQLIQQVKRIGCFMVLPMTQDELVRYCKVHHDFAIRLAGIDYRLNAYIPRHEHWLWQRQPTLEQYVELLEELQEHRNTRDKRNPKRFGIVQIESTEAGFGVDTEAGCGLDTETSCGRGRWTDTGGKPPVSQRDDPLSLSGDAANPSDPDSAGFAKGKEQSSAELAEMCDGEWLYEFSEADAIPPAAPFLEILEDPTEEALSLLACDMPPSPAAGQVPATELSGIRQRLTRLAGARYLVAATERPSEATEVVQTAPESPGQPKPKERPEKTQENDAVVTLLQRSSQAAGLELPPNLKTFANGWRHLARLYQDRLQPLLPPDLLEADLVSGLQELAGGLQQPLNWLMLLNSEKLSRHLASLVKERVAARPRSPTLAERFDHLARKPFFLARPPRASCSAFVESLGLLAQERHPETLKPQVEFGDLAGWWVNLRKLNPEALAAIRSDWLATAPPCQPTQHFTDTITLYCPLDEVEDAEGEGDADAIRRQARVLVHNLKPGDEKDWQHQSQDLFA